MPFDINFIFIFLPIAYTGYWITKNNNFRLIWLILCSYVFYAQFNLQFIPVLFLITLVNYFSGTNICKNSKPKLWFWLNLIVNLGILALFKYNDFIVPIIEKVTSHPLPWLRLEMPIGISFYMFISLTYPFDAFLRQTGKGNFLQYTAFVSFFPALLSGPISRWTKAKETFSALPKKVDLSNITDGISFFIVGLAKKVLIADVILEEIIQPMMNDIDTLGFFASWAIVISYTVQLYFDFSGYSDMAIGIGRLFGIQLPRNFNRPYQASNIQEFWQRWHISLSTWFRDYLFYPMSRKLLELTKKRYLSITRSFANILTMGLIGIWHGSGLNYALWGIYHGLLLAIYQIIRNPEKPSRKILSNITTLFLIMVGWVFLLSTNGEQMISLFSNLIGMNGFETISAIQQFVLNKRLFAMVFVLLVTQLIRIKDYWPSVTPLKTKYALVIGLLAALSLMKLLNSKVIPFVYLQF